VASRRKKTQQADKSGFGFMGGHSIVEPTLMCSIDGLLRFVDDRTHDELPEDGSLGAAAALVTNVSARPFF
jgi:histidine ammonia-lyase